MRPSCSRLIRRLTSYGVITALALSSQGAQPPVSRQIITGEGIDLNKVLETALANHPSISIQEQQIEIARGQHQRQSGAFDRVTSASFSQSRVTNALPSNEIAEYLVNTETASSTDLGFGSSQLLRSGLSFGPVIEVDRTHDNALSPFGVSNSQIGFQVTKPFLRGSGSVAVAGAERASGIEIDASLHDLTTVVAQTLANAASSYWALLASLRRLKVAADSEERGRSLLDYTKQLVDADRLPRSELNGASANLAARTAERLATEQDVNSARTQLALNMGLSSVDMPFLANPTDDFPEPHGELAELPTELTFGAYADKYEDQRSDVLAARERVQEADTLLKVAEDHLRPRLDVTLRAGYNGFDQGTALGNYLVSPYIGIRGLDVTGGITYSFFHHNATADGDVRVAAASSRQAKLQVHDRVRTASAQVVTALANLRTAVSRLQASRQAVSKYQEALAGEREKFRLGRNSLVDILTIEDRLTSALSGEVQARLAYADSLVDLRFASGTIVGPNQRTYSVDKMIFEVPPPAL